MHNKQSKHWWFAALLLGACTQLVDFDRGKIPDGDDMDASVGDGDGDGDGDDGGKDAEVDSYVPPACDVDTHDGCADTQLCCDRGDGVGATCVDVTLGECSACNTTEAPDQGACDDVVAVSCPARGACECGAGSGTVCSGTGLERFCKDGACVECMSSVDCTDPDKKQCVEGVCSGCNFADGAVGCANPTPVCRPDNSCVACDGSNACPNGLTCDDGSCFGCVVGTNLGCDAAGATPVCEDAGGGLFQCAACDADSDCTTPANPYGGHCVAGGSCEICDPDPHEDYEGCGPTSATPICVQIGSGTECKSCRDVSATSNNEDDMACDDSQPGTVCIQGGANAGKCGQCDPSNDNGCAMGSERDQCNPATLTCVDCVGSAGCGANEVCKTGGNSCVECNTDAECTDAGNESKCDTSTNKCVECLTSANCSGDQPICSNKQCIPCTSAGDNAADNAACAATAGSLDICVSTGGSAGQCAACDPADDDGCSGTNDQCSSSTLSCVDCVGSAGCGSNTVCLTGGNTCVECNTNAECSDEATEKNCDTATHTCVVCVDDGDCSGSTPLCNTTTNLCQSCVAAGANSTARNTACAAETAGTVCVETGASTGQCRACDPSDDDGCSGTNDECNPANFSCVECLASSDCSAADEPICESASKTCIPCTDVGGDTADDAACAAKTAGTLCVSGGANAGECHACDPSNHDGCSGTNNQCRASSFTCVDCTTDAGCSGTNDQCRTSDNTCVDCIGSAGCSSTTTCLEGGNSCVECNDSNDCADTAATPVCNTTSHQCVECLTNAQCTAGNLACISNACAECSTDGQCAGHPTGSQCVEVASNDRECRACDPGLLADPLDDQGCQPSEVCNETTFVCQ